MAKKIFNKVYEILSTAVITIGVLLLITYLCGIRLYHVKSDSMGEFLPAGSVCFVSTYSKKKKKKTGDVISFSVSDDMLVTHRAEKIMDNGIITKGDANNTEDPDLVTKENYIGKTVFAIPRIGRIFGFLHTLRGMLLLGIISVLLIISGIFYKKKDE